MESGLLTRLTSAEYGTLVQARITRQLIEHGQSEVKVTHGPYDVYLVWDVR